MTLSTEQQIAAAKVAYEKAKEDEAATKKVLEDLKGTQEPVAKAFEEAKKAYDALKPALNLAKAQVNKATAEVTITRAAYAALAPKEAAAESKKEGVANSKLREAVVALLQGKPDGMANGAIYDALVAQGMEMAGDKPRENLNSYLSRWGSAGALVNKGVGVWAAPAAPVTQAAPPVANTEVPAFLGGAPAAEQPAPQAEVPSFIGGPASTNLDAEFPGYEPLAAAGYATKESLAGKSAEELQQIPGIGAKTATKILEALAA